MALRSRILSPLAPISVLPLPSAAKGSVPRFTFAGTPDGPQVSVLITSCNTVTKPVLQNFIDNTDDHDVSLALYKQGNTAVESPAFYASLEPFMLSLWYSITDCESLNPFAFNVQNLNSGALARSLYDGTALTTPSDPQTPQRLVVLQPGGNQADVYSITRTGLNPVAVLSNQDVSRKVAVDALLSVTCSGLFVF